MKSKSFVLSHIWLFMLAIFLVHFLSTIFWLENNSVVCGEDVPFHLFNSLTITSQLKQALANCNISSVLFQLNAHSLEILWSGNYGWPRLVYFVTASFNLVFGVSLFTTIMANMFWFLILIVSVYLIGNHIGNGNAGLFAAFLTSFSPFIWGLSRKYGLDFPLTAVTSLAIYLLIKSEGCRNRPYTMLFFFIAGLGFNVKMSIIIFLVAPICVCILSESRETIKIAIYNLLLGIIVFVILSSLFWYGQLKEIIYFAIFQHNMGFGDATLAHSASFLSSVLFYIRYLLKAIGPVIVLTVIGMFSLEKSQRKNAYLIAAWAIIPIFFLSIFNPKNGRYITPIVPAFCIIAALTIAYNKNKIVKYFFTSFCCIVYLFFFSLVTTGFVNHCRVEHKKLELIGLEGHIHIPSDANYNRAGRIFAFLLEDYGTATNTSKIGILEDRAFFDGDGPLTLLYYIRHEMPDRFYSMGRTVFLSTEFSNGDFLFLLPSLNFLIIAAETDNIDLYKNFVHAGYARYNISKGTVLHMGKNYLSSFEVIGKTKVFSNDKHFTLYLLAKKTP